MANLAALKALSPAHVFRKCCNMDFEIVALSTLIVTSTLLVIYFQLFYHLDNVLPWF